VNSLPELFGTDDSNEISGDVTPYVRTIDAINPSDEMFQRISSGGITASLILPGFKRYVCPLTMLGVPTISEEKHTLLNYDRCLLFRWRTCSYRGTSPPNLNGGVCAPFILSLIDSQDGMRRESQVCLISCIN